MRVAVCDDKKRDRAGLVSMCKRYAQEQAARTYEREFESGSDLLQSFGEEPYEVVLLGILMGKENGIETARKLRRSGYKGAIVLVSASRAYYPEGFEVDAVHYLVKPYRYEDFREAMHRAARYLGHSFGQGGQAPYIRLAAGRQEVQVTLNQIQYIEVYNHTVIVHTSKFALKTNLALSHLEKKLGGIPFLRCHRSYIVNMDHIVFLDAQEIVLGNGDTIPVSRRERANIQRYYMEYMCNSLASF